MLEQILVNSIVAGGVYALVALGFGLVFRVHRFFHLAHGAAYAFGAYCAYDLIHLRGLIPPVAVGVAIMASAALGGLVDLLVYRPLRHRNATPLMMLIASLGIYIVIQNTLSLMYGDDPVRLRAGAVTEGINVFGAARITPIQIATVGTCGLLAFGIWLWLRYNALGKMMRAVGMDPELSVVVGVPLDRVLLITISIASILAASAGIAVGYDTDLTPGMGFSALLMGATAMILGGVGSVWGSLAGGFAIGLVQHFSALVFPTQWQDTTIFAVLVLCLLVRPQGLLGPPESLKRA